MGNLGVRRSTVGRRKRTPEDATLASGSGGSRRKVRATEKLVTEVISDRGVDPLSRGSPRETIPDAADHSLHYSWEGPKPFFSDPKGCLDLFWKIKADEAKDDPSPEQLFKCERLRHSAAYRAREVALYNAAILAYDREVKRLRASVERTRGEFQEENAAASREVRDATLEIKRELSLKQDVVRSERKRLEDVAKERDAILTKVADLERQLALAQEERSRELRRCEGLDREILAELDNAAKVRSEKVALAEKETSRALSERCSRFSDKVKRFMGDRRRGQVEADILTERVSVIKCLDMLEQHFSVVIPPEFRSKAEAERDAQLAKVEPMVVEEIEDRDLEISTFGLE